MKNFLETLGDCILEIQQELIRRKVTLTDEHWQERFDRPVNYGIAEYWDFEIAHLNDKPTRRGFHVNIYRLESGRYELNVYIL